MKHYWKLILKNQNDLSEEKSYSKHFRKNINQKDIVTYLINTDKTLKETYECYQGLIDSLKTKDFDKFKVITYNYSNNLPIKMKQALKLFRKMKSILKIYLNIN